MSKVTFEGADSSLTELCLKNSFACSATLVREWSEAVSVIASFRTVRGRLCEAGFKIRVPRKMSSEQRGGGRTSRLGQSLKNLDSFEIVTRFVQLQKTSRMIREHHETVIKLWHHKIPKEVLLKLLDSIPKTVAAVIKFRSSPTLY